MVGIMLAMMLLPLQERAYRKVCGQRGVVPEARLPFMMFGSVYVYFSCSISIRLLIGFIGKCSLLPFGLFIFAWTSMSHVHWIGTTIAGVPFGAAMVAVYVRFHYLVCNPH